MIGSYELKSSDEILQERKDKFKSIGENLQPDLVSFESIKQVSFQGVFVKNRNVILICLGLMAIFSFLYFFIYFLFFVFYNNFVFIGKT